MPRFYQDPTFPYYKTCWYILEKQRHTLLVPNKKNCPKNEQAIEKMSLFVEKNSPGKKPRFKILFPLYSILKNLVPLAKHTHSMVPNKKNDPKNEKQKSRFNLIKTDEVIQKLHNLIVHWEQNWRNIFKFTAFNMLNVVFTKTTSDRYWEQ